MDEDETVCEASGPIPRDRPDQQAEETDPLDIETMLRHAREGREEPPA
ncbi:hypothetical protein [Streptomyces sp. NPDC006333]